tara:strand:+ start:116 stop:412 length:297 start_codon:yes stop_codon:yes gene_type:complete
MAFKMKGFPFAGKSPMYKKEEKTSMYAKEEKTPMYQKEEEAKVQYAGGEVINTEEYKRALKDGVKSEAEFAEYKQMGREAWIKKNKKKVIEKLKVKKK